MKKVLISVLLSLMLVAIMAVPAIAANEQSVGASVTVGELVSITLTGSINFGTLSPGTTEQGANGQSNGNPAISITVEPETNVNVDIGIKGAITTGDLALSNWLYSMTFAGTKAGLTASYVKAYDNVGDGVNAFYHWITVPLGTTAGDHAISVSYKAVKNGTSF